MTFSRGPGRAGIAARRGALSALVAAILSAAGCMLSTTANETSRSQPPEVARAPAPIDVDRRVTTPPIPKGISQWDFGKAARWGDFRAFPGSSDVTASRWAHFGHEREGNFPDALTGDFVEGAKYNVTVTGLRKGSYRGAILAANVVRGMVPGRDFSVRANGITVVDVEVTPQWFFSKDGFFYGVAFDDLPGTDWWERYIRPYTQWRHFEFESNGRLELDLEHCRLYALVVAPKPAVDQEAFNTYIRATQAARKAHFLFNRLNLVDRGRRRRFRPTQAERERGYVIFSRPWWRDVTFHSVPSPKEKTDVLKAGGTPGERVPVTFSVRTLRRLLSVEVSAGDLVSGEGARIASEAIDVRAVRYKLREYADGFRIVPRLLQKQPGLSLPSRLTKRWWLTVNVPEGAHAGVYKGKITFKPSNGPPSEIDLLLRVYPFELANVESSLGVYYDDPRVSGYATGLLGGVTGRGTSPVNYDVPDKPTARDKKAEEFRLKAIQSDIRSLARRGFNAMTVPAPRVADWMFVMGTVELDFRALAAYPGKLKEHGINTDFPGQSDLWDLALAFVGDGTSVKFSESAPFLRAWQDGCEKTDLWWKKAGLPVVALVMDEPDQRMHGSLERDIENVLAMLDMAGELDGVVATVATSRDVMDGVDYAPVYEAQDYIQPRPWPHSAGAVEFARDAGVPLRYQSGGAFRRYPFGFYLWSQRAEGYWQRGFCPGGLMFNPFWETPADCAVYPSPEGPLPTPGYERAAQGIYDHRYALTLERFVTRARASGRPKTLEEAKEAAKLLRRIRRQCTQWTMDRGGKPIGPNGDRLQRWRKEIVKHILTIQKMLAE